MMRVSLCTTNGPRSIVFIMIKPFSGRIHLLLAASLLVSHLTPLFGAAVDPVALATTSNAVAVASVFLGSLSEAQRGSVVFAFDDEVQRRKWSNLPTPMYRRSGLRMGDLSAPQRAAALKVLAALLSPSGYEKAMRIVEGDELLRKNSNQSGGPAFGRDEFYISFLGQPSAKDPWMLQFGGHHLALNITIHGALGVMTPSHTAAQPATYTVDGQTVRPLAGEYDKAFTMLNSLDAAQKSSAIIGSRMADLVLGPGHDGKTIQPEGVKVATFSPAQRGLLLDLVGEWTGMMHGAAARQKLAEVKAGLDNTYFAWSGPTAPGSASYYRIQGPTVFIEFAPQNLGGIPTNHIHTMYRDPSNDYGRKPAGK